MNRSNPRMANSNTPRRPAYKQAPMPQRPPEKVMAEKAAVQEPAVVKAVTQMQEAPVARAVAAPDCLASMPLAMAYVPWQSWGTLYDPPRALMQGTIFPPLDLPFMRGGRS